jgi:hypothetical protein
VSTPEKDPVRHGHIADQPAGRGISFRALKRGPRPSCQFATTPVGRDPQVPANDLTESRSISRISRRAGTAG